MSGAGERRIALAAIAGAHGVNGEVRLKLFTESGDGLAAHKKLYVGGAEKCLLSVRQSGKTCTIKLEGIADRDSAEALRGMLLEVDRSALPPLAEGEYYHADLIGLPAFDRRGQLLGQVVAVENYGAGDLLDIERPDGKRALIPFRPGIADIVEAQVILDPKFLA